MMLLKTLLGLLVAFLAVVDAQVELSGPCNSYDREKLNEGYYKCVYKDPVGIPTIGVGFNLEKANAREEIESVGADYNAVLNGKPVSGRQPDRETFRYGYGYGRKLRVFMAVKLVGVRYVCAVGCC